MGGLCDRWRGAVETEMSSTVSFQSQVSVAEAKIIGLAGQEAVSLILICYSVTAFGLCVCALMAELVEHQSPVLGNCGIRTSLGQILVESNQ